MPSYNHQENILEVAYAGYHVNALLDYIATRVSGLLQSWGGKALPVNAPLKNRCAKCTHCVEACPAGAIKNASTDLHYATRQEAVDLEACVQQLRRNEQKEHIPPYVCGVCVSACPWGKHQGSV